MKRLAAVLLLSTALGSGYCQAQEKGENMTVEQGRQVSFEYTLTVDGNVLDTSQGREPLEYTHGEGKIIPGLSRQLEGMAVGEEKAIDIAPSEAYGEADPKAVQDVPKAQLPKEITPQAGMTLKVQTPDGVFMPVKITEVKENSVLIDFNHPLAGKTLHFDVKIVSIK